MAAKVSNQQILNTLEKMGYHLPGPFDARGAQHGDFKNRVMYALEPIAGDKNVTDLFSQAEGIAVKLQAIPADAKPLDKLVGSLKAWGVSDHDWNQVLAALPKGRESTYGDFSTAVQNVLGQNPAYAGALHQVLGATPEEITNTFKGTGQLATPPLGAAPPVAPPAPAPPAGPGGVTMGTTVSRATPGVAAKDTTAPAPAAKPPPGQAPPPPGPQLDAQGHPIGKALDPHATDAQVEQYFRDNYGADLWMVNVPDFKDIMRQVATNPSGWSLSAITSAVQKTPWWQANGQHVADYLTLKGSTTDFNKAIKSQTDTINGVLTTYGMTLPPEKVAELADEAQKWGWTPTDINQHVSQEFHFQNSQPTAFTDKLKQDARKYLVPVDDATIQQWGQRIIADPNEENNYNEMLKNSAKSMFPTFAPRLDTESMLDIAKPYANTAATLLEKDPNEILDNITDPKWMAALDQVDPKTGVHTSMSYSDWSRKLKDDSVYRYDYTEQAKQAATGQATDLLKRFGAI